MRDRCPSATLREPPPSGDVQRLTAAIILLIAVYQWAARLGALGAAQMDLMTRYWQGALGVTALAVGCWLAWLSA